MNCFFILSAVFILLKCILIIWKCHAQEKLSRINSHEILANFMQILRMKKRQKTSIRISHRENTLYSCEFYKISCDLYTIIM